MVHRVQITLGTNFSHRCFSFVLGLKTNLTHCFCFLFVPGYAFCLLPIQGSGSLVDTPGTVPSFVRSAIGRLPAQLDWCPAAVPSFCCIYCITCRSSKVVLVLLGSTPVLKALL